VTSRLSPLLALALIAAACADGREPSPDADVAADGDVAFDGSPDSEPTEPALPEPPEPPASPVFTPCPAGWREVEDPESGLVTCDPWPTDDGAEECEAIDEAHFPGETGCMRIGPECPSDSDWARDLPADEEVLFVLAGAEPGGDGSREAPYDSIVEAVEAASSGSVVAVGRGTYDEVVDLPSGVTLQGACVAETLVASSSPSSFSGTLNVEGRDTQVKSLRIGGRRLGVELQGSAFSVHLEGILVEGAQLTALLANGGGRLTAREVVVRDTQGLESDGTFGRGLDIEFGATAEVSRAVFERNREVAVVVSGAGSELSLENVLVRDTLSQQSDEAFGRGLTIGDGASATVCQGVFEGNRQAAITVDDEATELSLLDVVIRDTLSRQSDGAGGHGLDVQNGASATVTRTLFERNIDGGVRVDDRATELSLLNVVVRDTLCEPNVASLSRGLLVQSGSLARVSRAVFERNCDVGIVVSGPAAELHLEDVVVRETLARPADSRSGRGLVIKEGAIARVVRAIFERNRDAGMLVSSPGTGASFGDIVVRETESRLVDGVFGRGFIVRDGASVTVARASFDRNRDIGVTISGADTAVRLEDVVVTETLEQACARDSCADSGQGDGVVVICGGHVEVRRFRIADNAWCGLMLAHGGYLDESGAVIACDQGGTIDLHDGIISGSAIGANIQTEGFDLDRLADGVVFRDNGVDLDSYELPVPEISEEN